jgi:hypothetical protein
MSNLWGQKSGQIDAPVRCSLGPYDFYFEQVQLGPVRTLWKERTWKSIWTSCGVPDAFGRTGPFCCAGALQSLSFNNRKAVGILFETPWWVSYHLDGKQWRGPSDALPVPVRSETAFRVVCGLCVACELTAAKDVKSRHLCPHGGSNAASDLARWGPDRGDDCRPKSELVIVTDFDEGNSERTPTIGLKLWYETIRKHGVLNIFNNPRDIEKELAALLSSCPATVARWVQSHPIVYIYRDDVSNHG